MADTVQQVPAGPERDAARRDHRPHEATGESAAGPRETGLAQRAAALNQRPAVRAQVQLAGALAQRPANALPRTLQNGLEQLSGMALGDVRVHYNSTRPAAIQAHAYTQGRDIHIAAGQESHLPHEAWHVVQQRQNRVKPTLQAKGVAINDEPALEREADRMGERALRAGTYGAAERPPVSSGPAGPTGGPLQRKIKLALDGKSVRTYGEEDLNGVWRALVPHIAAIATQRGRKSALRQWLAAHQLPDGAPTDLKEFAAYFVAKTASDKEKGRARPDWDHFWAGFITNRQHRRHIVMSSIMRNAVYAITDSVQAANAKLPPDELRKALQALIATYRELLSGRVPQDQLDEASKGEPSAAVMRLETMLVSRLHNHRLNIFIGPGAYNSAIGGMEKAFDGKIDDFANRIGGAEEVDDIYDIHDELIDAADTAGVFGHNREKDEIREAMEEMLAMVGTYDNLEKIEVSAADGITSADVLEVVRDETLEILEGMRDSTAADVSQASDEAIKRHQNSMLNYNKSFIQIRETKDMAQFKRLVLGFFAKENFPGLDQMTAGEFQKKITADKKAAGPRRARAAGNKPKRKPFKGTPLDVRRSRKITPAVIKNHAALVEAELKRLVAQPAPKTTATAPPAPFAIQAPPAMAAAGSGTAAFGAMQNLQPVRPMPPQHAVWAMAQTAAAAAPPPPSGQADRTHKEAPVKIGLHHGRNDSLRQQASHFDSAAWIQSHPPNTSAAFFGRVLPHGHAPQVASPSGGAPAPSGLSGNSPPPQWHPAHHAMQQRMLQQWMFQQWIFQQEMRRRQLQVIALREQRIHAQALAQAAPGAAAGQGAFGQTQALQNPPGPAYGQQASGSGSHGSAARNSASAAGNPGSKTTTPPPQIWRVPGK